MSDRGPRDLIENSPLQMQQVIGFLLQGKTAREVSDITGVPLARITRWYRSSPDFQQMLSETEGAVVEAVRSALVDEQAQNLIDLLPQARQVFADSLDPDKDVPHSVRVTAAAHVFRLSGYTAGTERGSVGARPAVTAVPVEGVVRKLDARPASGD